MTERFEVVIIGSGVGGGTVAHALSETGARVLVVERGDFIAQEDDNWSAAAVWGDKKYRTEERWVGADGEEFVPYTHYCVGGNSKFWGSTLYRLRKEDFGDLRHKDGLSPAWPIDYETLAPYYDRAERLYSVHGEAGTDPTDPPRGPFPHGPIPHAGRMVTIVDKLRALGLNPAYQPLGLIRPGEAGGCILCDTCNSFPCKIRSKSDADVCTMSPALEAPSVTLWTNAYSERLVTSPAGDRVVAAEIVRDGARVRVEGDLFVVSCGAVNSASLLLRSRSPEHPDGLANSSGLVGRRYMAHLATMLGGFHPPPHKRLFTKTVAINDFYFGGPDSEYPLGNVQSNGRALPEQAKYGGTGLARHIPRWLYAAWFSCGVEWLVMTEDLPDPDNRVTLTEDGRIRLVWRPSNAGAHQELVEVMRDVLKQVGFWFVVPSSMGTVNTTHQCGTAVFGTDPKESVLDPWCRSHDVDNLFVVDGSFFPSSAAVNPALTIAAQALRSADHIKDNDLS